MSFFKAIPDGRKSKYNGPDYITLTPGEHTIRIISTPDEVKEAFVHYVAGAYVECLGDDCPVCESNKRLMMADPEGYKNSPEYNGRTYRFWLSVFDKTPAKICPNCGAEIKAYNEVYPVACTACNALIANVEPTPLNKIKILGRGKTLRDEIEDIATRKLKAYNIAGLTDCDITLFVSGKGRDTKITADLFVLGRDQLPEAVLAEERKLGNVYHAFTRQELQALQSGVKIKDIYSARQASADGQAPQSAEVAKDIAAKVSQLFNN